MNEELYDTPLDSRVGDENVANVSIDGKPFVGTHIKTQQADLLMIQGRRGFLGCGYFDVATANKVGDALAVVRGVTSFDEMQVAEVVEVSETAVELGVTVGMSGREALLKMC